VDKVIPILIIPVLNRYDLLDKSLESIDYEIDEILIINNGVEDYVAKRSDLNIKVLNLPSNQGIAGSWNLGIKLYPHKPWWLISSADTSFMPGSLKLFDESSGSDKFVKSNAHYSAFSLGENIVAKVGLFDEYIYPAYYEDNDYDDRMVIAGFRDQIICPGIQVDDSGGSQTIKSDVKLMNRNNDTFGKNGEYYRNKKNTGDYSVKGWDLIRRRENEWLKS
jgi:GT2 family glycosyltransferase